ncbi:GNAT family N-acetyltransferase [Nostoc sp. DSM 114161]|jgi:ribosomal protein S18 acetylase RimI-like enzyme|uniref:GNAT family N-acetyltransferase n=1 Tax=Nostoc sp. DSM 114161 TaxID=3440143 RepID=UPI00404610B5
MNNTSAYLPSGYILRTGRHKDIWGIIKIYYFELTNHMFFRLILFFCIVLIGLYLLITDDITKLILLIIAIGCLAIIIPIIILILLQILSIIQESKTSEMLMIEYRQKVVAFSIFTHLKNYSEIKKLHVKYNHRHKGLGSYLVRTIIQKVNNQPIYLLAAPKALHFYIRLKFVPIPRHKLPKIYSKASHQGFIVLGFISK